MSKQNENLIIDISDCSVIGSVFVISAIEHYAKQCVDDGLKDWSANSFIPKEEWLKIAETALELIKNR